ncbi:MAG: PRC-barrel domain containing protein [Roseinatronobacter sp.]|nr:MAG: PRC-barrel domain containing protein [Roseinatronobacter sp.]
MQRHMKFEEEEMLLNTRDLVGYRLTAIDGAIGIIDDLLIDDRDWTIRWITVDTGNWLHSRKVLLPPQSFGEPDHLGREIPIDLDRKRVEQSPTVARDHSVSRQVEADIYAFYDYPPYWSQGSAKPIAGVVGNMPLASIGTRAFDNAQAQQAVPAAPSEALITDTIGHGQDYPHLRSTNEMMGYYIEAKDGSIGHVEDILIEGHGWETRYLLIDTRSWWPGRKVLISPKWASSVSWSDRKVYLDMTREHVRTSPEYDPRKPIDHSYEERLHAHYGYEPHWLP